MVTQSLPEIWDSAREHACNHESIWPTNYNRIYRKQGGGGGVVPTNPETAQSVQQTLAQESKELGQSIRQANR